jgi:hypothetical protein
MRTRLVAVLLFAVGCDLDSRPYTEPAAQQSSGELGDPCSTTRDCVYAGLCDYGHCSTGYACTDDASCAGTGSGQYCRHDVCHPPCHGDLDCHQGELCSAAGTCEYARTSTACAHSCECPTGQICSAGACVAPPADGAACSAQTDCAQAQDCVDAHCRAPCSASTSCSAGETCAGGHCQPDTACSTDCECPSGQHCSQGTCG